MSHFRNSDGPRNSNSDLQDYYDDGPLPPPHRLSSYQDVPMESRSLANNYSQLDLQAGGERMHSMPAYNQHAGESYPRTSDWAAHEAKSNKRSKWLVIGAILLLLLLIVVGIVAGVLVSRKNTSSSSTSSNSSSNSSKSSPGAVNQTDANDPSTFVQDPRLKKSFWGLAYTPENSQLPNCGNKLADVITDIQLISQLTTRIRLYGADCNQSALVLEAIQQTKTDITVYLGNYVVADDNGVAYTRQRDVLKEAIMTYGTDHVVGVTVGNEFMLNYVTDKGSDDANSAIADVGAAILTANIADTKTMLEGMSLTKTLPLGNSDAGSYFSNKVLAEVSYGMANVHPWFAAVSIDESAAWTNTFFQDTDITQAAALSNKPNMFIAETGWPTKSSDAAHANNGPSIASVENLQKFLDTFICQANTNGTGYFFFSYGDEPWKDAQFGGVEGWWGLFDKDRELKDLTIPDCVLT